MATKADDRGNWKAAIKPYHETGPISVSIRGKNIVNLKNVLVGEVWVCSGQSNMEWRVSSSNNAQEEIAVAKYPKIRLFKAARTVAATPQDDVQGAWVECSPKTVGDFSAVGYFFGRALHKNGGEPIGLIKSAWGGTPAESWTTAEMMNSDEDFKPLLARWKDIIDNQDQLQKQYRARLAKWQAAAKKAKAEKKSVPRPPSPPHVFEIDDVLPSDRNRNRAGFVIRFDGDFPVSPVIRFGGHFAGNRIASLFPPQADCDIFTGIGLAPELQRLPLLQHHVVADDAGQLHIRLNGRSGSDQQQKNGTQIPTETTSGRDHGSHS